MRHAAITSPIADVAPPIVHEVLRGPGNLLDCGVRTAMEQRFGHDFSRVRVHADTKAAESARAVNAEAYTVGSNIVFAAGKAPGVAPSGLLAHELAHVVQQGGAPASGPLRVALATDPAEREADSAARLAMAGRAEPVKERRPSGLLRQEAPDAGVPDAPRPGTGMGDLRLAEQRAADEQELSDQQSAEEQARAKETGPVNMKGRMLTKQDIDTATKAVQGAASPAQITPRISGACFVLHDTGAEQAKPKDVADKLKDHVDKERRSAGEGAAAWVTKEGKIYQSHDPLFGSRRPTATRWERGEGEKIGPLEMTEAKIRELLRAVWASTAAKGRSSALENMLTDQGLGGAEAIADAAKAKVSTAKDAVKAAKAKANAAKAKVRAMKLKASAADKAALAAAEADAATATADVATAEADAATAKAAAETAKEPADEAKGQRSGATRDLAAKDKKLLSAGTWAVESICSQVVDDASAAALAVDPAKAKDLKSTCTTLNTLFAVRKQRIAETVNVEMVKPTGPGKGYETAPGTRAKFPPYGSAVYDSVRDLYVKAALEARVFPEITTHRLRDQAIQGAHGDPRCFNLHCLYERIAAAFGHVAGTHYGLEATAAVYGLKDAVNDRSPIWWDDWVCDGKKPGWGSCPGGATKKAPGGTGAPKKTGAGTAK